MNAKTWQCDEVRGVEALMLEHFQTEPFHNLGLLYPDVEVPAGFGGTCSDKTVSFVAAAKRVGFNVHLHSGFIGGREIHRLARVRIGDRDFFADVGNGWPALRLYPADADSSFLAYGMEFRSVVTPGRVLVYHEKHGKEALQLEIDIDAKPEAEIHAAIDRRFADGIEYPFSGRLRFSLVVGQHFLFLRDDRLEIYRTGGFQCIEGIAPQELPTLIRKYFGFDLFRRADGRRELRNGSDPVPAAAYLAG